MSGLENTDPSGGQGFRMTVVFMYGELDIHIKLVCKGHSMLDTVVTPEKRPAIFEWGDDWISAAPLAGIPAHEIFLVFEQILMITVRVNCLNSGGGGG